MNPKLNCSVSGKKGVFKEREAITDDLMMGGHVSSSYPKKDGLGSFQRGPTQPKSPAGEF